MKGAPLNEQAAALLRAAAGYVRKGHVRHANARKANGALCDPESPQAVCWCAQGALLAGLPDIGRAELPPGRAARRGVWGLDDE